MARNVKIPPECAHAVEVALDESAWHLVLGQRHHSGVLQPLIARRARKQLREAEQDLVAVVPGARRHLCAEALNGLEIGEQGVCGALRFIAMPLARRYDHDWVLAIESVEGHWPDFETTHAFFPVVYQLPGPPRESLAKNAGSLASLVTPPKTQRS